MNISRLGGFPLFVTQPHFLHADPILRECVDGMPEANPELDDTYVVVNSLSGVTIGARQSLQVVVKLENMTLSGDQCSPISFLNLLPCCKKNQMDDWDGKWEFAMSEEIKERIGGVYVPVITAIESFQADADLADQLMFGETMMKVPNYIVYIGFPVAGLLLLIAVYLYYQRKTIHQRMHKLSESEDIPAA